MKRLSILFVVAALLGGCGGSDESTSSSTTGASGASGASGSAAITDSGLGSNSSDETSSDSTASDETSASAGGSLSSDDESQIEDTAKTWLTSGGCDLMTDKFLEAQTFEKDRDTACKTFETIFTPPSFDADQITVTKIEGDGSSASAVIGDTLGSGVSSTYKFEKVGDTWQIDQASL